METTPHIRSRAEGNDPVATDWPQPGDPRPVWTSRYQHAAAIVASGLVPVRITLGRPKFRLGYELAGEIRAFAPTAVEFHIEDRAEFTRQYTARLDRLGIDRALARIDAIRTAHGGKGVALLCFEVVHEGSDFCHRRVLADWLTAQTGLAVPELSPVPPTASGEE